MKQLGKTKDGIFDDLLRAYVSRPAGNRPPCPDFDPDLANAYVERGLTGASRSRYEEHLAACAACRKSVVVLSRLAMAEASPSASGAHADVRRSPLFTVRQWLGAMSAPQWGMAAAAVVVLAISLPLLLSRTKPMREDNRVVAVAGEQPATSNAQDPASAASAVLGGTSPATSKSEASSPKPPAKPESDAGSLSGALAKNTQGANEQRPASEQPNNETKSASQVAEETQKKSENQVAAQAPAESGAAGQVAKTQSDSVRQQTGKDAVQSSELSKSAADQATQKEDLARTEAAPPPAPSVERDRSRDGLRRAAPKLSLREGEAAEAARLPEKKVGDKTFRLKEGTWTDKKFDPDRDVAITMLIRDSNVYKELLSKEASKKHSKLKAYLTGFLPTERVIFLYEGKVYKLIPQ